MYVHRNCAKSVIDVQCCRGDQEKTVIQRLKNKTNTAGPSKSTDVSHVWKRKYFAADVIDHERTAWSKERQDVICQV